MADLVIIHPGAAHGIYGSDLAVSLVAVEPPLWPRLIAGYIKDRGYSVEIIDAEVRNYNPSQAANLALAHHPKLICIAVYGHQPSASTQQMDAAREIAVAINKLLRNPPKVIMVGGHVAALPEQTLREECIDYACNGEGPETILGLLRGDPDWSIPGLVYGRVEGLLVEPVINNASASLLSTDDLHGQAWELLPMTRYRAHNWQCFGNLGARQPYASIYTSLGCPYKCSFCCINAPFGTNAYRMRRPADVVAEIQHLYTFYGIKTFKIIDELFVLNTRHYVEICERLTNLGYADELNIWCYARVDTVREDTLNILRKGGIRWLALGIESASAYVRDGAQKRLKNNDIAEVVGTIQDHGINVIGNYIFGLPDDTMETMHATLDLAIGLRCEFANFYSAMAYPGSPLYTEAIAKGWDLPDSWRGYSQHNADCHPLSNSHLTAADVVRFRDAAFTAYFTDPGYLDMVERKFGAETLAHIKQMTTFKLKRKLLPETMVV